MGWWEPGESAAMVVGTRSGFERIWGHSADVVASAPGRVNLIGEHTDYNRGLCLPLALRHATYVAAAIRQDDQVRIASAQTATPWIGSLTACGPGRVTGWPAYVAGVLWALGEQGWPVPGLDLYLDSTVPPGAGLSSSASLECATGAAVAGLLGFDITEPAIAHALVASGVRAEGEVACAPTGGMDQTIAVYASPGTALLLDFDDGSRTSLPLDLAGADLSLLVIDTQVSHALTDGGYATRRAECEQAARLLGLESLRDAPLSQIEDLLDSVLRRRARHVVTENTRVRSVADALNQHRAEEIGPHLMASHDSLRDDFEVSCPELDLVVETAVSAGAIGARMTGGGFGGSALALVPEAAVQQVRTAVLAASALAGNPEPRLLRAQSCTGARVLP